MTTEHIIKTLTKAIPSLAILRDEPMKNHCTFRIGGPAELFLQPRGEAELVESLAALRSMGVTPTIIGKGSNILVRDEGIKGVTVQLGEDFADIRIEGECVYAQAGATLASIASAAMRSGLAGMEFAHGIPGSLGGAVMMNAGAYGGEMRDIVESVRYLTPEGEVRETADCSFAYRHSRFEGSGDIILGAKLRLGKGDIQEILAKMRELIDKRTASQPLDKPSAGSTFKRPATGYAAAMIDQAGLKGFRIGGAMVSDKHAGFVVNVDNATFADVAAVMEHVQKEVYARFGVLLEPEVRVLG